MIASREGKSEAKALIIEYYDIFRKLCMLLYSYQKFDNNPERASIFSKFSPKMIENLTNYIIP